MAKDKVLLVETHPHLVSEWKDEKNVSDFSTSSAYKASWECAVGHCWTAAIYSRTRKRPSGCPYCSARNPRVIKGVNDISSTHPWILEAWRDSRRPDELTSGSSYVATIECRKGHRIRGAVSDLLKRERLSCPYCDGKKVLTGFNDLASSRRDLLAEWRDVRDPSTVVVGSSYRAMWECRLGHKWKSSVFSRSKEGCGCPYCPGHRILTGFNDLESRFPEIAREWADKRKASETLSGSRHKARWKCLAKGHVWVASVANRTRSINPSRCPQCSAESFVSRPEQELFEYVSSVSRYPVVPSSRHVIPPYELDIYVPDSRIAFEFNGDYWHSDEKIQETKGMTAVEYHRLKQEMCQDAGVLLMFVWESDWKNNKEEVKLAILNVVRGETRPSSILTKLCLSRA